MLLQQGPRFYNSLELACCLFLAQCHTSSVTWNHTMDWFYLLKENFKNLLFDSLITRRSFKNLSYLSSCSFSQRWRFRRIRSNVLLGIESNFAYTEVSGFVSQYILRSGSLQDPSSSTLKNNQIFSLLISKLMSAFSLMTVPLGVAKIHIN